MTFPHRPGSSPPVSLALEVVALKKLRLILISEISIAADRSESRSSS